MVERGGLTVTGVVGMEWLNKMEKFRLFGRKEKASPGKKNKQHLFVDLFTMSSTKQSLKKNNQKARHKTNQVSFSLYTEIVCFAQQ